MHGNKKVIGFTPAKDLNILYNSGGVAQILLSHVTITCVQHVRYVHQRDCKKQ